MTPSPNDLADTGGRDVAAAGHGWQLLRLPVRSDFDPELSKRDLARMWRCSTKDDRALHGPGYVRLEVCGRPKGTPPVAVGTPIRAVVVGEAERGSAGASSSTSDGTRSATTPTTSTSSAASERARTPTKSPTDRTSSAAVRQALPGALTGSSERGQDRGSFRFESPRESQADQESR